VTVFTTLALYLPLEVGITAWALLAARALWALPDWVGKWLDVRDRCHSAADERRRRDGRND